MTHPLTDQERVGLRRLVDCGAISERGGGRTQLRYMGLVSRGYAKAKQIGNRHWLFTLTPSARAKEGVLRYMLEDL